jgi:hypothetical protein
MISRGLRNNNPGNLRSGSTPWLGQAQVQSDPDFVVFTTPEYGIRALAKTLMTYSRVHGCGTVRALIDRFAPPSENDTQAYVAAVSESCGVPPDTPIDLADPMMMGRLVEAVIRQENGRQPYTPAQISAGLALAGLPPLVAPGVADAI